ncbi:MULTISPECIES: LuxR C-terminal-related transcriptional regulator [unclassified Roseateles]|uniref:LuxR C-terminal-related transcriptional regulator n=1 Tax=unclassified Roseateles TaxID=2626991 RepID=UPI0006F62C2E|nr:MULTISPECIES: LuxR C-terminal-related transcriptional regulator [unclassified Roseateles]KQW42482.1 LuxR family transcriptional regulator [Pelomonas sp. Root405]KRA68363.1 LuxR family transcriptional regulator [Pelomonas sp. Root662]
MTSPSQTDSGLPTYHAAFQFAPIGLVLSAQRQIVDCNERVLQMFSATRDQLVGKSFSVMYPSAAEFERTGARIVASLDAQGHYGDDRVMRRLGSGELFWCHVTGRALDRGDPHARGIWSFEDLSARRQISADLTPREREIAALLVEGQTSKLIGRRLGVSPRTVDVYRGRLMKKYQAGSTPELIHKLLSA